ncbi:MAG: hypothetical protein V4591_07355 [Bdellovibrionota bacterium]
MELTNLPMQITSLVGAFIVLTAYIGHQLKWKIFDPDKYIYNICNSVASILLTYVAFEPFQAGFVIMEGTWGIVSIYTLMRVYKKNKQKNKA